MRPLRTALLISLLLVVIEASVDAIRGGTDSDQDQQVVTRRHEEPALTIPSEFNNIILDENLVKLSILSAKIARCVNKPSSADECSDAKVFDSTWGPDKAIAVYQEGICFGAFQATTWSSADWGQNLDPGMADDVCSPHNGICCPSRRGFRNAYQNVSYLSEFEQTLEECKQEKCGDGKECDLILTGYSQGGAVAMVGAVFLNPTAVFTFGQPPTMEDPCYAYDTSRVFRYVNTAVTYGEMRYDIVPFLGIGPIDHMGHLLVLSDDTENVAYYRDHEVSRVIFRGVEYLLPI